MGQHTRREFLSDAIHGAVAAGTGLMVMDPLLGFVAKAQLSPAMTQNKQAYTAGKFAMELDGQVAGWIESVTGGHALADTVVTEAEKVGQMQSKHIAGVKYEDVTINCGAGMSRSFYDWIKASFDKQRFRKNGAVVACDYNYKVHSRMEFFNALITEIGFPACDAGSKDPAKMTIKFAPESTRMTLANAGSAYQGSLKVQAAQKKWLPSNFRLKIDGLDCAQVRKIEGITAKLPSSAIQVGAARLGSNTTALPSVSNLIVSAPESREFYQWYEDSVIRGNTSQVQAKRGMLDYLAPDLRESIFSLSFSNLRILKLVPSPVQASNVSARLVMAEMYCSDVAFSYGPAALV